MISGIIFLDGRPHFVLACMPRRETANPRSLPLEILFKTAVNCGRHTHGSLAEVSRLGPGGASKALKMLSWHPQGRHYRPLRSSRSSISFGNRLFQYRLPFVLRISWRENMAPRHCSQSRCQENGLGRHYSRFSPMSASAREQYQLLA